MDGNVSVGARLQFINPPPPWTKIKMAAMTADDIFRCVFANEKFYILIQSPIKFIPNGPIDNNPALV